MAIPPAGELRAVTFDCWNTLLYERGNRAARELRLQALERAARGVGTILPTARTEAALDAGWLRHFELWNQGIYSGSSEMAGWSLEALGVRGVDVSQGLSDEFERAGLANQILPLEGAKTTLARLAERGLRRALICDTGFSPGHVVREMLDRAGLLELLEVQVFSNEIGVPKPSARMFESALKALETPAASAVHVGDLLRTDVAGARAVGMGSIRIRGSNDDASEHPEADAVADSHGHLLELLRLQ